MYSFNPDYESKERFDLAKFIEFSNEYLSFDVLNSTFLKKLRNVAPIGEITVTSKEAHTPDAITYKIFDEELYWWILLYYNDIDSIDAFTTGKVLKIPNFEEIERIFFNLRQRNLI